uniref:Arylformamidase n=1 Tax=Nothoprocta perdicaria TaxID=30464 RepID=A0A8C6ZC68_NOTPE
RRWELRGVRSHAPPRSASSRGSEPWAAPPRWALQAVVSGCFSAAPVLKLLPAATGREQLDLYLPREPRAGRCPFPVLVYIHGGYWQCLSKDVSGFAAPALVSRGIALAAVGYSIAPQGRRWPRRLRHMDEMVAQVRRSLVFLVRRFSGISGLYLCGHSAGAHLAAMVLATDWAEYEVTPDIKGTMLVSGIYDLEPLLNTYVNEELKMSQEVARRNSPVLCVSGAVPAACEVLLAVAQHDSPEFRRQSREYCQVSGHGVPGAGTGPAAPAQDLQHQHGTSGTGAGPAVPGRPSKASRSRPTLLRSRRPCARRAAASRCWTSPASTTSTSSRGSRRTPTS